MESILIGLGGDAYYKNQTRKAIQIYNSTLPEAPTLPTPKPVNPMRIDEERFKRIYASKVCDIGLHIKEYNSTLPTALVPLPKEMPEWFAPHMTRAELWDQVVSYYGTPEPKPSLPTVEELRDKMYRWVGSVDLDECEILAQNLHEKYSLPTREDVDKLKQELEDERIKHAACGTAALGYFTGCHEKYLSASLQDVINLRLKYEGLLNHPREWWQDLKKGDKFMRGNDIHKFSNINIALVNEKGEFYYVGFCTPYTPPSAQDIIAKHNLSEEEVKAIREGK
jgi:hypothetical protein